MSLFGNNPFTKSDSLQEAAKSVLLGEAMPDNTPKGKKKPDQDKDNADAVKAVQAKNDEDSDSVKAKAKPPGKGEVNTDDDDDEDDSPNIKGGNKKKGDKGDKVDLEPEMAEGTSND